MRRLVCLGLLTALVGCTATPTPSTSRGVSTDDPITPDATKLVERLPPPEMELPDGPLDNAAMIRLAKTDPVAFVSNVVGRYDREVRGYRVTLEKQERVGGKLLGREVVRCAFREKPFSVLMDWQRGAGRAQKTLYVEGENKNQLLVLGSGFRAIVGVVTRDPHGDEAKASSRYPVTDFGIQVGTRRVLEAFKAARKRGDLKVVFGGEKKIPELKDRTVWELKRVDYPEPEKDGILEETFYFDTENWLQIGSVLKGEDGKLIATYYFRDLELNPDFPEDTFTRAALTKK